MFWLNIWKPYKNLLMFSLNIAWEPSEHPEQVSDLSIWLYSEYLLNIVWEPSEPSGQVNHWVSDFIMNISWFHSENIHKTFWKCSDWISENTIKTSLCFSEYSMRTFWTPEHSERSYPLNALWIETWHDTKMN